MAGTVPTAVVTLAAGSTIEVVSAPVSGNRGTVPPVGVSIAGAAQTVTVLPVTS